MARKPRNLTDEERQLWEEVRRTTRRMHPEHLAPRTDTASVNIPAKRKPIAPFQIGTGKTGRKTSTDLAPGLAESLTARPPAMDATKYRHLKRGKISPESRIDLHGMTLAQAHPALTGFIQRAYSDGQRLVLVITGKGKSRDDDGPIPVRHGVLRHQVPHWLQTAPLRAMVLQVTPAHLKHGGTGAYYVYLRRAR